VPEKRPGRLQYWIDRVVGDAPKDAVVGQVRPSRSYPLIILMVDLDHHACLSAVSMHASNADAVEGRRSAPSRSYRYSWTASIMGGPPTTPPAAGRHILPCACRHLFHEAFVWGSASRKEHLGRLWQRRRQRHLRDGAGALRVSRSRRVPRLGRGRVSRQGASTAVTCITHPTHASTHANSAWIDSRMHSVWCCDALSALPATGGPAGRTSRRWCDQSGCER